eukprot:TRINITY_DN10401_c0_g1_i1.p1 TRINITY_DN10401_c0_g1~~TRINITY_DN10401_c0_g1_i1.p1  ORF type:complete len:405 (+),score=32.08 TRINITY_DN10401_c0_g1_i1:98-1312(+)
MKKLRQLTRRFSFNRSSEIHRQETPITPRTDSKKTQEQFPFLLLPIPIQHEVLTHLTYIDHISFKNVSKHSYNQIMERYLVLIRKVKAIDFIGRYDSNGWFRRDLLTDFLDRFRNDHICNFLDLSKCSFNNTQIDSLTNILSSNTAIRRLVLSVNNLNSAQFLSVAKALSTNSTLIDLEVSCNNLSDDLLVTEAMGFLGGNTTLRKITIYPTTVTPRSARAFAEAAKKTNVSLQHLNFAQNDIEDGGAVAIASILPLLATLTTLDLRSCKIDTKGMTALAKALGKNIALQNLDLTYNQLGGLVAPFAEAIEKNSVLKTLNISENSVGVHGAQLLADALRKNSTLTHLYLAFGNITNEGGHYFLETLTQRNRSLTRLHLIGNKIDENVLEDIYLRLRKNQKKDSS